MDEQLTARIGALLESTDGPVIVGIDGGSCSGKSFLANRLGERFGGNVFHCDDFFLRPEQRTPQRLQEPGGNMDRERLLDEVLLPLSRGETVTYRPFSCGTMTLLPPVTVPPRRLSIVEGSYSLHPSLRAYYGLAVFLKVPWELRLQRLYGREGDKAAQFLSRWLPMENAYFSVFGIAQSADLILDPSSRAAE